MITRRGIGNGILVLLSLLVAVIACEIGSRFLLNPADYLSVTTESDPVLGIRIAPRSAGMDAWGFRNPAVPSAATIVTLGDSHTFGNTARMQDAWPTVLGRITGRSVYNLGLGGYGPNQYYHLLMTRGLVLQPDVVLCGLYMGDDFENAFSITYGLDHWSYLRSSDRRGGVDHDIWDDSEPPGALKTVRNWLSRESILYRLTVHGPLLGEVKERIRFNQVARGEDPMTTSLRIDDARTNIREAFRPLGLASRLDQSRPEVREGMRITFQLLTSMDRACRERQCMFAVIIIPTKETVFAEQLQRVTGLHLRDAIDMVIVNERAAKQELVRFLDQNDIAYVDALPAMRRSIDAQLYAPTTADMHPGANGYRVIGETASEFVGRLHSSSQRN